MNKQSRVLLLLVVVGILAIACLSMLQTVFNFSPPARELTTGEFFSMVERGDVATARWQGSVIEGELAPPSVARYTVVVPEAGAPSAGEIIQLLKQRANADPKFMWTISRPPVSATILGVFSVIAFPLMIIALIYFLVLRPAQRTRQVMIRCPSCGELNIDEANFCDHCGSRLRG